MTTCRDARQYCHSLIDRPSVQREREREKKKASPNYWQPEESRWSTRAYKSYFIPN